MTLVLASGRHRGNHSRACTRTILSLSRLDLLSLWTENIGQRTVQAIGKVRVLAVEAAVNADRAALFEQILFLHDRSDTACTEACRASTDELSHTAEKLPFILIRFQAKEVLEQSHDCQQFFCRVCLNQRQECSVKAKWFLNLVCFLTEE